MKINCPTCDGLMSHKSQRCAWCRQRLEAARAKAAPPIVVRRPMPKKIAAAIPVAPIVSTEQQQWTAFRARIWPAWNS